MKHIVHFHDCDGKKTSRYWLDLFNRLFFEATDFLLNWPISLKCETGLDKRWESSERKKTSEKSGHKDSWKRLREKRLRDKERKVGNERKSDNIEKRRQRKNIVRKIQRENRSVSWDSKKWQQQTDKLPNFCWMRRLSISSLFTCKPPPPPNLFVCQFVGEIMKSWEN